MTTLYPGYCQVNSIHPNGRVHADHRDEEYKVPRGLTLPAALFERTFTFPVFKTAASRVAPINTVGRPETADYTVQHWAIRLWRVHSVHRCELCGDAIEVGSYLYIHVYTLSEEPLIVTTREDGTVDIQ